MLFQHTIDKVLAGEKTQTRRVAKSNEMLSYPDGIEAVQYMRHEVDLWRTKWQVGKTYAVQPGRGKPAVARIEITAIRRGDVRKISKADAIAEGFTCKAEFLRTWVAINDKRLDAEMTKRFPVLGYVGKYTNDWLGDVEFSLNEYPAANYDAWILHFTLAR